MVRPVVGLPTARSFQWMARSSNSGNAEMHGDCSDPYVVELTGQQSLVLHRLDRWGTDAELDIIPEWGATKEWAPRV